MEPADALRFALLAATLAISLASAGFAQNTASISNENTVLVGGTPMYPSKNIVENAVNSKDHTTLVAAVKAAGLVPTLEGPGPFTVFGPTNEAFDKLPPGTLRTLMKPENKQALVKVLTYHVVPGVYTTRQLMNLVAGDYGEAMLKTVEDEPLKISTDNGHVFVSGEKSGVAEITIPNVMQSNGILQVVNSVPLPE